MARVVWALGITQIIGYGTLYYAFSVLAPAIGAEFSWSSEWVFAALSAALLAGGLLAPFAGHAVDRFGAAQTMAIGSVLVALALAAAAVSPNGAAFAVALIAMEAASTLVLYAAGFAALVQLRGHGAQRSITHLTLIAGFASTLFWPLTAWLSTILGWREIYLLFAGLNLLACGPFHWWLAIVSRRSKDAVEIVAVADTRTPTGTAELVPARRSLAFMLLLGGFAIEGFILSGILMHIIPLLGALGLAGSGILITTLFGPAQVLSRLINMVFGSRLRQAHLGVIAATLLPLGVLLLALTAPSPFGGIAFAVLFGLGSGLTSIVSGSLPLELFGRERYGSRLGWVSSARQVASAVAPFLLALLVTLNGVECALFVTVALGVVSVAAFFLIAVIASARARAVGTV